MEKKVDIDTVIADIELVLAENKVRTDVSDVNGQAYAYTVDGVGSPGGMAFSGAHIHFGDRDDDNVRMILPPSSDGAADVVYTYTVVAVVSSPQGLAF